MTRPSASRMPRDQTTITARSMATFPGWKDTATPLIEAWEAEMTAKGKDGKALVDEATALIDKYSTGM